MKKYNNGTFNLSNLGEFVTLYGWVAKKRDLGGLIFIDLRDRSGIIQIVINPENKVYNKALEIKNEYVLKVEGKIIERQSKNMDIPTGEIEVEVSDIEILNTSEPLPIEISGETLSLEDTRLKYRYLDLRRPELKKNFKIRHAITRSVRNYLEENDFIEIETPILNKSTPEGARDYLVPSRINKGSFYALPQSPQIFKQLLMVSGFERYYQIARCFRDEDLRADRQPEFTQIDMEMSFADEEDIFTLCEGMFKKVMLDVKNIDISTPFPRLKYDDSMKMYGTDKPDTRFELLLNDITQVFNNTEFTIFKNTIQNKGIINCLVIKNSADKYSRKNIDELTEFVKKYDAKGLAWSKYVDNDFNGGIAKNLNDAEINELKNKLNLENNDLILIVADKPKTVYQSLGALRNKLGKDLDLINKSKYNFLWITDFPMFEYSEIEKRYMSAHHPFTMPKNIDKLDDPENCYARAYDSVLNGYELASGSVRIHDRKIQSKVFEALKISDEEAKAKFGFLLEAFKYGAPPHIGIAFGLERLTMILADTDNIRDVVAFPKTASASCLMSEAPSEVDKKQLDELGIKII